MQSSANTLLSPFERAVSVHAPERETLSPRVLHLATGRHEGGLERSSIRLASLLQDRGAFIRYGCHPGGFVEARCGMTGIRTLPLRVRNSGDVGAAMRLACMIEEQRIEIVHVHSRRDYVPAVLAVAIARRTAKREGLEFRPSLLLHVHQIRALGGPSVFSDRFFAWGVDQVVVVSEPVRERVLRGARFPSDRVRTIENGIDLAAYAPPRGGEASTRRQTTRRAWGLPQDALVVGMVGSLGEKGQEILLRAVPALLKSASDLRVVLAGPEKKRGRAERLRRLAAHLGIADRVILPGVVEDVPSCMAAIDILAHLPADEAFGLTIAEAMAAGVPVVASDAGGCRTIVRDGRMGYLVPHGDIEAVTGRLSLLLDPCEGAALRTSLGHEGRSIAERFFALETQADRMTALYRGMLSPAESCGLGETSRR